MFLHRIEATPNNIAYRFPDKNDNWQQYTWKETGDKVREISGGLCALGLAPEERCSILSNTRVEWILIDLGILCAGGATTTIYPSSSAEESQYIIHDSGTVYAFVEDASQVKKVLSQRENLPNLRKIINMDIHDTNSYTEDVINMKALVEMGTEWNKSNPDGFVERINNQKLTDLATLIYTSGTTGTPKGVELLHDCWVFEAESIDRFKLIAPDDVHYLWLPLSHSFGKVLQAACIRLGTQTAIDGRVERLVDNLAIIQPTFLAAVPRVFEKVYNKVIAGAKAGGGIKYELFKRAIRVGEQVSQLQQKGLQPSGLLKFKHSILDRLVLTKIRARFGGNIKFFISGSAPLSAEIANFFHAAGMLIVEGYGLTESSAASFVNLPSDFKFGTVGKPIPGVELSFLDVPGEEGTDAKKEILIHGRGIMRGYYNLPEASAEVFHTDENGKKWLRTGDAGELDSDGFLKITDRIKNLIKTSGGKYVAPQKIEGLIKTISPLVSQALVHGNKRNFCSMLLTVDAEALQAWANEAGLGGLSYEELTKHDALHKFIQGNIDELNKQLMKYETIKKFAILPADLSIETGELTPSQKMKRKVVEAKYADILDGFYEGALQNV
jgi:long-chain acyl-CoA synthetase